MSAPTRERSQRRPAAQTAPVVLDDSALPTAVWSDWSCLVRLVVSNPAVLEPATEALRALMRRVELAASRFLVDSELNWANANAGRPVAISRTLASLVEIALDVARRSGGLLDPTLGADLSWLGYDRDIALVAGVAVPLGDRSSGHPADRALELLGRRRAWSDVRLDPLACLLTVPIGCGLDLGATAKAITADWAAAQLHRRFGCDVLVELGGDLAVAGSRRPWQLLVAEQAGGPGQQITFTAGGLATSTTTIRRWQLAGRPVHHILDPATGRPADGPWRTVTVAAGSAVQANTCSTAAIVLGAPAVEWLTGQRVAARLVDQNGDVTTVGGWPC